MARDPLRRRDNASPRYTLSFDGTEVPCVPGESLVTSLWAEGKLATSRSAKYRRARGAFCLRGDCGTCLVRADGRPNRRACTLVARAGMQVGSQNKRSPDALDPTRLVDAVFRKGMDHHHLMVRPRIVNQVMQTVARDLTGFGHLPAPAASADALASVAQDQALRPEAQGVRHLEVLVVGAGAAGRAVALTLEQAGVDVCLVDRRSPAFLKANPLDPRPFEMPEAYEQIGIFAAYPDEGLWAGHIDSSHAHPPGHSQGQAHGQTQTPGGLRRFRAQHVVLATGARDTMIPFDNNDRPGVVAARGLAELLERDQLDCDAARVLVVGDDAYAQQLARHLGCRQIKRADVLCVRGSDRVRALEVKTTGGRREKIDCDFVALASTPAPAHELATMAGAQTRFDTNGFAVERDDTGRCARFGDTQVWAVGDLCGYVGPQAAAKDGARVAAKLVLALRDRKESPAHVEAES